MDYSDGTRKDSPLVLGTATCKWEGAESRVLHVSRLALNYAYLLSLSPPPHGATISMVLELAPGGPLPPIEVGDYLVHYAAGAYNWNLSPDFIFETPPVRFF